MNILVRLSVPCQQAACFTCAKKARLELPGRVGSGRGPVPRRLPRSRGRAGLSLRTMSDKWVFTSIDKINPTKCWLAWFFLFQRCEILSNGILWSRVKLEAGLPCSVYAQVPQ